MTDITPSPQQAEAIKAIKAWYGKKKGPQEFYVAGYAGTGKSTIVNIAIEEVKEKHKLKNISTAAYTGKAASVLRRKGVKGASTIHSLIYTPEINESTGKVEFVLSEESSAAKRGSLPPCSSARENSCLARIRSSSRVSACMPKAKYWLGGRAMRVDRMT